MFETTFILIDKGGGERNGIEGIVVGIGIVGIEGMLGSGGKVTLGRLGIVGRLGSGGSAGLGMEGCAVGNVGCGSVGIEGNGGNVGLGKLGTEGLKPVFADQSHNQIFVRSQFDMKRTCPRDYRKVPEEFQHFSAFGNMHDRFLGSVFIP
ncbi:hypothetical protein POTOM_054722 [Populus tomentosa]|uniref:Uncharacterized protein n=1 Tax=Populus tomentosa TaxID=118781 RepID=A0A8X7Y221_POPTO|nr:hypothetical protein POTOM_054722 [Populus tomentosa]